MIGGGFVPRANLNRKENMEIVILATTDVAKITEAIGCIAVLVASLIFTYKTLTR